MSIPACCTRCGHEYLLPDHHLGKRVRCKACGETFVVRDEGGDAAPARDTGLAVTSTESRAGLRQGVRDVENRADARERGPGFGREAESAPMSGKRWTLPIILVLCGAAVVLVPLGTCIGGSFLLYTRAQREEAVAEEEAQAAEEALQQDRLQAQQERAAKAQERALEERRRADERAAREQRGREDAARPNDERDPPRPPPRAEDDRTRQQPQPPERLGDDPKKVPPGKIEKKAGEVSTWEVKSDPAPSHDGKPRLTGSIPLVFGGLLIYSTSPDSAIVAITQPGSKDKNLIQVYDLRQMKPVGNPILGKFDGFGQTSVVSPDGNYFATLLQNTPTPTIEVFSSASGKSALKIEVEANAEMKVGMFDFVGKDRLLTMAQKGQFPLPESTGNYAVWDLKTGKKLTEFSYDLLFHWKWGGFSPGREFMVLEHTHGPTDFRFIAWDLATGKSAGELAIQDGDLPWGQAAGISFSPDGEKLAMIWRLGKKPDTWGRLLCWEVKSGKKLHDHKLGYVPETIDSLWFEGGAGTLQWLPEGNGWLLFGHSILDYESGAIVGTIGNEPRWTGDMVTRRFLDRDHISTIEGGAFDKKLSVLTLPREQIDAAVKKARGDKAAPR